MTIQYKMRLSCTVILFFGYMAQAQDKPLWKGQTFSLYSDKVVQGSNTARALSPTSMQSDYQSPANLFQSPTITFKFSINGKDNEMKPGVDHLFSCYGKDGLYTTELIRFGDQYIDPKKVPENLFMSPNTKLTIRLDMRHVLDAFSKTGFYSTWDGQKIFSADFKSVFLAGGTTPMSWDFDNLHQRPQLHMKDPDGDGIYETTVILNEEKQEKDLEAAWNLKKDISAFPQYQSPHILADAIYNLSLEEMENAIEPDSTFRTGKEWAGVWTRDISYSIILSMAYLQPKVAMYSLMKKVKNGKIIQDTGTGGAYPVSTDRMIWAMAAWQIYLASGDKDWLTKSYAIIKRSVDDDRHNAYDKQTGMVKGESSFLDWREQTYPKWMQPADIYASMNLGTNAVHYQACRIVSLMAKESGNAKEEIQYRNIADQISKGINEYLWMPDKGYYAQYLYGRGFMMPSPRSEALGEALCILFGIADPDRARQVIQQTPQLDFGIPCIYPQISQIPPYHNRAVWPFVQSYWALAAAKTGHDAAVMQSFAAIYRPAALFLTNKENFVADNGDYKGTQINSSNMLWSLSGNIALVHKILFGIHYETDGLYLSPFVPKALSGNRSLKNFRYRDATIDVYIAGHGKKIQHASINGKTVQSVFIPSGSKGHYSIRIQLSDDDSPSMRMNLAQNLISLPVPLVGLKGDSLQWTPIEGATHYQIYKNGQSAGQSAHPFFVIKQEGFASYQVIAVDKSGIGSFASEPLTVNHNRELIIEAESLMAKSELPYKGFTGEGFSETGISINNDVSFSTAIPEDGLYGIDIRYSNGHGPVNTENKCGIRTLWHGRDQKAVVVFPQRGNAEWSNWGYSNIIMMNLKKGNQSFRLNLAPENENMNGQINAAMLDHIRFRKIK